MSYRFADLAPDVKEDVKRRYQVNSDKAIDVLKALAKHFNGKLKNYSIDWFNNTYSDASFNMPVMEADEIERRTDQMDPDALSLTGWHLDYNPIKAIKEAFRSHSPDLDKLMQIGFRALLKAAQDDCADFYSDEQFGEHCDANEMWFNADGTRGQRPKGRYVKNTADVDDVDEHAVCTGTGFCHVHSIDPNKKPNCHGTGVVP